tara:strand:+ start:128365 stop:128895 length:531 start_codon:yes stop_codon:yes gene_type:complete
MKQLLLALTFFITAQTFGQQKESFAFFTSDINLTFKVNENFELGNSDEPFLVPSASLIRVGFGYEFKKKFAVSFNTGIDMHFSYSIFTIPTYVGLQYNLWARDDDALFIRANFGRLWRTAKRFSDGDYRAFGFGWRFESRGRWRPTMKLMYHRKKIKNFEDGNLDSVSLGIGILFF